MTDTASHSDAASDDSTDTLGDISHEPPHADSPNAVWERGTKPTASTSADNTTSETPADD